MILIGLLFCFFQNLMAQTSTPAVPSKGGIDINTKPIMCDYRSSGPNGLKEPCLPDLAPELIPCECDIVLYGDFYIDSESKITCDTELLKRATSTKPVIISLYRLDGYFDWSAVLKDDNLIAKEVDVLIDFAQKNNVIGYKFNKLTPEREQEVLDLNVAIKIVHYLKLLKEKSKLIVGFNVNQCGSTIKNPCVTPFAELNSIVDFYAMRSYYMNPCSNDKYNGLSPIKLMKHGSNYFFSLEEIWKYLEASKCDLKKVYFIVELMPTYSADYAKMPNKIFENYNRVCSGCVDPKLMCIPDTHQLYAKGNYIKQIRCGVIITFINLDNFEDDCGCETFVGTKNVYAGYYAKEKIPCKKFDVQKASKGYE